MRHTWPLLVGLAGCPSLFALPDDQACREVGYAIAERTYTCTGDEDLSNERYLAFDAATVCEDLPDWKVNEHPTGGGTFVGGDTGGILAVQPQDWFHCAFAIRELPCELVVDYAGDFEAYLTASDACPQVVSMKDAP